MTVILIVEDDEVFRGVVSRAFRLHGHVVREAASSEAAAELLERGLRPDLVLLDLNLPGETGWAFVRGGSLAAAGSPPVLVVTGTGVRPRQLEECGIAGYLPKPFPLETLLDSVERLVREKEARRTEP